MDRVIDASIAVKWLIPEPNSEKADELLIDFRSKAVNLLAPDHIVAEVANALWKRSALLKEITPLEASQGFADFEDVGLQLAPAPPLVMEALELAAQERHPVYDMLFIVLAMRRRCEFITADEKMVRKLGKKFEFVRWLGDL